MQDRPEGARESPVRDLYNPFSMLENTLAAAFASKKEGLWKPS
jgi:hypothetical protein